MADETLQVLAFNRGLLSPLALARVDLKRAAYSAETMENWQCRSLGSMMLRPGTGYLGSTNGNAAERFLPFVFRTDDTALVEFTTGAMRVWVNDVVITRPAVTSAVTNGDFTANLNNWTDNDEAGATSDWVTDGAAGGYMRLVGNGSASAIRDQQVTVPGGSVNVEHALHISVFRGPVTLRVGSTSGGIEYVVDTVLRTGVHSIAFTPIASSFWIRFYSALDRFTMVDSCNLEAAGAMSLASPYLAADLDYIRGGAESQSADVIFVACMGYQQRRIERQATRSWSLVLYQATDGPYRDDNVTATTIASSALLGNVTLTASTALFKASHVGAIFSISSAGQQVIASAVAQNTFTGAIRVTGIGVSRTFAYGLTGLTASGSTVTLQRSLDSSTGPWTDLTTFIADVTAGYTDGLDNQIAWYRIGVKTGGYGGGTQVMVLSYAAGSITGVVRITDYTSPLSVGAEVLTHLGNATAVTTWAEGAWSDYRGWPTAVALVESRLAWSGKARSWISTTDAYDTFLDENLDGTPVGDSGPIERTIGFGPVDVINWAIPLQRLILGAQGGEFSCRSNAFDDPITPTAFAIKACSGEGSAPVSPVKIDNHGVYVQRGGKRVFELEYSTEVQDYTSHDLTLFYPEAGGARGTTTHIVRMAVQRQPDTRIHCIRSDGIAAVLVYDKAEDVKCWLTHSTNGTYEDVVVLPSQSGSEEDQVYYVVKRTINGATVRYLEKWALESECIGATLTKLADAFVTGTQIASTQITGLTHLIGATVICWHDGICEEDAAGAVQTYVVDAGGAITVTEPATHYVVGLPYDAPWMGSFLGHVLLARKKIWNVGLLLKDTHARGLRYGGDFNTMDYLPLVYQGAPVDTDAIYANYNDDPAVFPDGWGIDKRLCLKASAPRPVTVLAAVPSGEINA